MDALLIIIVIAVVVGGFVIFRNATNASKLTSAEHNAPPPKPLDPFVDIREKSFWDLKAPDLVKYNGQDFFVRRSIESREGSYRWMEHLLDDGAGTRMWLSVEDADGLDLGLWHGINMVDLQQDSKPGDASVVTGGKAYKRIEGGTAKWQSVNSDDTGSGVVDHIQYEAADKAMLSFQRYDGGEWQASVGERLRPSDLEVYPATGQQQ